MESIFKNIAKRVIFKNHYNNGTDEVLRNIGTLLGLNETSCKKVLFSNHYTK